jgi:predicted SnoaL-like aldol condensation-catalyzing enzyme
MCRRINKPALKPIYILNMKIIKSTALLFWGILLFSCNDNKINASVQAHIDSLNMKIQMKSDSLSQLETNKTRVANFYQELFGNKDSTAIDRYIGSTYIQHNPALPDGKEALKKGVAIWFKGQPKEKVDIQHLGADGNLVYIHTKAKMGPKTVSVIDIFRIENGKIVEHWDVLQDVPVKSANPHPMF